MRLSRISATLLVAWALIAPATQAKTFRYRDADNGLLGTLARVSDHQLSVSQQANVLSLVVKDNSLSIRGLRRLQDGQPIRIADEYLNPSFRPTASVISASERILDLDDRNSSPAENASFSAERKSYQEQITKLRRELREQKSAAEAFHLQALNAESEKNETAANLTAKADKARQEATDLRALLNDAEKQHSGTPWKVIIESVGAGAFATLFLGLFGLWYFYRTSFTNNNFVYAKVLWCRAPNGERKKFTYDPQYAGYTCEDCARQPKTTGRELGVGIQPQNLEKHLAEAKVHSDLWLIRSVA